MPLSHGPVGGGSLCILLPRCEHRALASNFLKIDFRKQKGERERNVDLLFHLCVLSLVGPCLCPDWISNPQPTELAGQGPASDSRSAAGALPGILTVLCSQLSWVTSQTGSDLLLAVGSQLGPTSSQCPSWGGGCPTCEWTQSLSCCAQGWRGRLSRRHAICPSLVFLLLKEGKYKHRQT